MYACTSKLSLIKLQSMKLFENGDSSYHDRGGAVIFFLGENKVWITWGYQWVLGWVLSAPDMPAGCI